MQFQVRVQRCARLDRQQFLHGKPVAATIGAVRQDMRVLAVTQFRGQLRFRGDADRQYVRTQEGVDQRALACTEGADDRHQQLGLLHFLGERPVLRKLDARAVSQCRDPVQQTEALILYSEHRYPLCGV
ncbi:hypothetical protein D3C72_1675640 [compost metagenome]